MSPKKPAAPTHAPDQDQRDLILTGLDRNMLVEAAAGTGKTTSMVGRMVALLRTGTCEDVRSLAAVTFTRKAAAELRARFQVELERAVRAAEGEERARLERALGDIEHCFIGTIHSFCGRLLRERPVEAGVDLAFTRSTRKRTGACARRPGPSWSPGCWPTTRRESSPSCTGLGLRPDQLARPSSVSPTTRTWTNGPCPRTGPPCRRSHRRGSGSRPTSSTCGGWPHASPPTPAPTSSCPVYRRLPRIASHYDDLERPDQLMEMLARFDQKPYFAMSNWSRGGGFTNDEAKAEKSRWYDFRDNVALPMRQAWREHRYLPVMRMLLAARDIYDLMRSERGCLNFQDLLMKAAALLRDQPARPPLLREALHPPAGGRVPGHRPHPGRGDAAAHRHRPGRDATGGSAGPGPAPSSWWATPSSPSTASAAPTSSPTTRSRRSSWETGCWPTSPPTSAPPAPSSTGSTWSSSRATASTRGAHAALPHRGPPGEPDLRAPAQGERRTGSTLSGVSPCTPRRPQHGRGRRLRGRPHRPYHPPRPGPRPHRGPHRPQLEQGVRRRRPPDTS